LRVVWRKRLTGQSMAGIAANEKMVLVPDRDPLDTQDVFRCLNAETGEELWTLRDFGKAALDYGNAPRATPQMVGEFVVFYGALGKMHCVRAANGEKIWKKDFTKEFGVRDLSSWGSTSSPLVVDEKLIVNPGGPQASVAALKPESGEVLWKTPGDKAAFGSFVLATLGGKRQIVGYDAKALCGWEIESGEQLWRLVPPRRSDFNVPTPIVAGEQLVLSTENNGTRLYGFHASGKIIPEPVAVNDGLAPDTHTPVAMGDRLFGVWHGLYCLDLKNGLKTIWKAEDPAFNDYATAVACGNRVLIISKHGELLLVDAGGETFKLISRVKAFDDDPGVYSHPAFVGKRIYLRGSGEMIAIDLAE
jgi:outer membrane protein assembly factor BamB